jgi:dTDP-4-amino-4,6-dideoxygalactose transaminase
MSTSTVSPFSSYPLEDLRHCRSEILRAIEATLDGGAFILGHEVAAFETEFAAFNGCRHAIGVANGTDAIELLLRALGIGPGHQVAVPSQTAVASVSAIERAGAAPVFVDIDLETFTIDPEALTELLASPHLEGIRAVLAVHLYGHPSSMDQLQRLCDERKIILFEDCAQAHGASWQGRPVGSLGHGAAFSFYPTKNLGAIGDGGAVTTNDDALANQVRCLRQYGWRDRYISAEPGVNSRLDEIQAAILRVKLRRLADANAARRRLAALYGELLGGCEEVRLPVVRPDGEHAFHLFVIRCARRDALCQHLVEHGIPAALHYPAAVHQQPAYRRIAARSPALPRTEEAVRTILSLPLHPYLSEEAVRLTASTILEFYASGASQHA